MAQENILEIITRKGNGVLNKMKRKLNHDYNLNLFAVILIPCAMLFLLYWNSIHPDLHTVAQMSRSYAIIGLMEVLVVFGLIDSIKNRKFMDLTFNTGTIKESMEQVHRDLKAYTRKSKIGGMVAINIILIFILIDIFMSINGFKNLNFTSSGAFIFESYYAVFVILLMATLPAISRLALKRYTQTVTDIEHALEELREEDFKSTASIEETRPQSKT